MQKKCTANCINGLSKTQKKIDNWLYDLNTFKHKVNDDETDLTKQVNSKICNMFSKTLFWFYLFPFLFVAILLVFNVDQTLS